MMRSRDSQQSRNLLHLDSIFHYVFLLLLADLIEHFYLAGEDTLAQLKLVFISRLNGIDVHFIFFFPLSDLL